MKNLLSISLFILSVIWPLTSLFPSHEDLVRDLLIVDYWNKRLNEKMPVTYNHLLQGGYWYMPSARMGQEGEIGLGYVEASPYRLWNLRCQLTDRLEVSGNYRIFKGVDDPVLSQHGFGDFSDKGVNFKIALFHPEDSDYQLPGLSLGFEDVMGTKAFNARYAVLTKVFSDQNLEISLGYGSQRIRGWFGGFNWMPFLKGPYTYLKSLSIAAEYDAIPYKDISIEPHPKGRKQKTSINFGLKYRLWDQFDFSLSYMRGQQLAASVSTYYNFGSSQGVLIKSDSPKPYLAPVNIEPLGELRPESVLVPDLVYAFRQQGLTILQVWLSTDEQNEKVLHLRIVNEIYRLECDLRTHLDHLIANLTPIDVSKVIVGIDAEGAVIQEYQYCMEFVRAFAAKKCCSYELKILTPLQEATKAEPCTEWLLFNQKRPIFCFNILPKNYAYFGSSKGKFKYAVGLEALLTGYVWDDIFYSTVIGYVFSKNIGSVKDVDRLNPSQLINVRTDIIRYFQKDGVTLDEAYLQKSWNLGKGWFFRVSGGYFEIEYGGIAGEFLWYPVNSRWAFGVESAVVWKRKINSCLSFTGKIRKLDGFKPSYHSFTGSQYFVNLYYQWKEAKLDLRLKAGKFLAHDYGVRYEVSRYFPSGLRITLWYTQTNGHDKVNGETYYDKGIAFTMPMDFFYTRCDRGVWGYGMSAWLRDVGAASYTGQELYYMLNDQRPQN